MLVCVNKMGATNTCLKTNRVSIDVGGPTFRYPLLHAITNTMFNTSVSVLHCEKNAQLLTRF